MATAAPPPVPLVLVAFSCLPHSAEAASDTTGVLTVVAIVLGCSVVAGGLAVIGWYCWKQNRREPSVQPKPKPPPPPKPANSPLPPANPPMMLVAQSPMPGMQGIMIPAGGMMMGYPAGMSPSPGTALYQVPVQQQPSPSAPPDNTSVEDLEGNNAGK
ncbi:vegetative cell wall protein gp1-like [Amphibalanus amphitrite]|uniref:vegetative cell wall protein gp1-like n=1 Tax=Amphibalanus amphitrite TaxID=1232801 RepID=UPI001C92651F|nr:vegetative cell wall protein gp1-like [Amphibalanus amphitrite]